MHKQTLSVLTVLIKLSMPAIRYILGTLHLKYNFVETPHKFIIANKLLYMYMYIMYVLKYIFNYRYVY